MKTKTRKFKVNNKVKLLWPKKMLEDFALDGTVIVRRFDNDYSGKWYYVSSRGSLRLWLVAEVDMRKVKGK